jgi:transcriptional regulator with XRE-family HTH domain
MIDDQGGNGVQRVLAANLRRMRIARHLSLSELARATAISKATLSGIERGRANPTVDTLTRLAGALRTSVGELLQETSPGEARIVRSTEIAPEELGGIPQRLLAGLPSGASIELAELLLSAHQTYEVEARAGCARLHLYVLAGKLIAGPVERYSELASGDYASFPADVPHVYETARNPARALRVTELPS